MNNWMKTLTMGLVICGSTALLAQTPEQSPFDDLLEGITAEPSAPSDTSNPIDGSTLSTAYQAMVRAQQQLERGEQVEGVVNAQQTAIDALDELLQQFQQPPPPEPPSNAPPDAQQSQSSENQQSPPPDEGEAGEPQSAGRGGDGDDNPSEEQLTGDADTDPAELQRRLQQSVWGHLPDRVRQQLQASMPDEFHPRYKRAIAEYFRQLTHPGTAR